MRPTPLNHQWFSRETERFVYRDKDRRPTRLSEMHGVGDFADWATRRRSSEALPSWAREDRTKVELRTIKTEVETNRDLKDVPRPVTPKAKETLKIRTVNEIFGSKECQEWYINQLREALEKMDGDKLYDFIRAHPRYGKADYRKWNRNFAAMLGLNISDVPEQYRADSDDMTYRRLTAAAQHMLVEFYKTDVFQLTFTKKKINPWVFIDGKMGPYTVSVLNDYWMARYSKTSSKNPQPPGRSGLNSRDYPSEDRGARQYDQAMDYLTTQTGGRRASPESPATPSLEVNEALSLASLEIREYTPEKAHDSMADLLKEVYGEKEGGSPKTNRLLQLLTNARQDTAKMSVNPGETLRLSKEGHFTVQRVDKIYKYNLFLRQNN